MAIVIAGNTYGKSRVRVSKVIRNPPGPGQPTGQHGFVELDVDTRLHGDFERAYTHGDNCQVLPTDTQKNTVLALAAKHPVTPIEGFARVLAEHFLSVSPAITGAFIRIAERRWVRAEVNGSPHPHAFLLQGDERRFTELHATAGATAGDQTIHSGIQDLVVLKTTGSGFSGFLRDEYTTLAETEDRIFATSITARFRYGSEPADFDRSWAAVRQTLITTFAEQHSPSVQHTLHEMGQRVLAGDPAIAEIQLTMPNIHHLPLDLSRFGVADNRDVFLPTSEPYGHIEATIRRE